MTAELGLKEKTDREAAIKEKNCYLFVHFIGESPDGEQIYFSISRDGAHFCDVNGGQPVLRSTVGEGGVRDPFLIRSVIDGKFYIIATDLRIANGKGWGVAQEAGSRNIVVFSSDDLVHWSEPWLYDTGLDGAGCVWAPEATYDEERGAYLVFWASKMLMDESGRRKQEIFRSYTKDFRNFSEPKLYIELADDVIDTTIVKQDGVFYRFSKDEVTKRVILDCGRDLIGEFKEIKSEALASLPGVEGPIAFLRHDGTWCVMLDQFAKGAGYLPLLCRDLSSGKMEIMDSADYDLGRTKKRHGGILPITGEEYERVKAAFGA